MKNNLTVIDLEKKTRKFRKDILDISYHGKIGHLGSAFSIIDILTVLYYDVLNINSKNALHPKRDRFILSKGHAASALYVVLSDLGFFSKEKLWTFCRNGGVLGVHPDYHPQYGIELSTGSLGHGLSVGAGMALGLPNIRVFVLISDAELNEGSVWEAVMFAAHHRLDNLTVIIDDNRLQAFGRTKDVINMRSLKRKWESFKWGVTLIDGHSIKDLRNVFNNLPIISGKPNVIIAKTIIGKGISFMEDRMDWHYWSLSEYFYKKALKEIKKT